MGWNGDDPNDDLNRTTLICWITRRELSPEDAAAEEATPQQLCISSKYIERQTFSSKLIVTFQISSFTTFQRLSSYP